MSLRLANCAVSALCAPQGVVALSPKLVDDAAPPEQLYNGITIALRLHTGIAEPLRYATDAQRALIRLLWRVGQSGTVEAVS
jgi:hypothetical protein